MYAESGVQPVDKRKINNSLKTKKPKVPFVSQSWHRTFEGCPHQGILGGVSHLPPSPPSCPAAQPCSQPCTRGPRRFTKGPKITPNPPKITSEPILRGSGENLSGVLREFGGILAGFESFTCLGIHKIPKSLKISSKFTPSPPKICPQGVGKNLGAFEEIWGGILAGFESYPKFGVQEVPKPPQIHPKLPEINKNLILRGWG